MLLSPTTGLNGFFVNSILSQFPYSFRGIWREYAMVEKSTHSFNQYQLITISSKQSINQTKYQLINQSIAIVTVALDKIAEFITLSSRVTNPSIYRKVACSKENEVNRIELHQSINQSMNQLINPLINQSFTPPWMVPTTVNRMLTELRNL